MPASYPVYRHGIILSATREVSAKIADLVAANVRAHAAAYRECFIASTTKAGARDHQPALKEAIRQHHASKRVFDFPAIDFNFGDFSLKSRSSLTVCVGKRQSKVWTRFTCAEHVGQPAIELSTETIKKFFEVAKEVAEAAIIGLLSTYKGHLEATGVELKKEEPFSFSFRAYNSQDRAVKALFGRLSRDLTLKKALEADPYQAQLRDFFDVAMTGAENLESQEIVDSLKERSRDIFTYRSPRHRALYTLEIGDDHAALCGFGYDQLRKNPNKTLAFATTSGLLEEYAHRF